MWSKPLHWFLSTSAVLSFGVQHFALAQSSTPTPASTPTQTWTPAAVCSNGLPTPSALNGTYIDHYGATYAVQCGQDSTGVAYDSAQGTNGQGVYACFKGCDSRPGCTGFSYQGTVLGPSTGAGQCFYKSVVGTYFLSSGVYAGANLITKGTPFLVCPWYNGTTFTASDNTIWQIYCGFDITATAASTAQGSAGSVAQCMAQCNAISDCTMFTYTYTGSEPSDTGPNNQGTCYYKKGTSQVYGGGTVTVNAAIRIGTVASTSTSTSIAVSTTAGLGLGANTILPSSVVNIATTSSIQVLPTTSSSSSVSSATSSSSTISATSSSSTSNAVSSSSTSNAISTSPTSNAISSSSTNTAVPSSSTSTAGPSSSTSVAGSSSSTSTAAGLALPITTLLAASSSQSSSVLASTSSQAVTTTTTTTTSPALSTTSSTNTASASAACTAAPIPFTPVCPSANATSFLDSCGTNYTVYCGFDSNPGAAAQQTATSLLQCMQLCDAYTGCVAASYVQGGAVCFLKTGFSTLTGNSNVQTVIRYIPPNPLYSPPVPATSANASTGCGLALPGGLVANGPSVLFSLVNPTDGLLRNYTVHIPQYYDPNRASPVIFAFPGNGEGASNIEQETGLSNAALNPYAIVVYVNGYGLGFASNPRWGVPGQQYGFVDDIGFMKNLVPNITSSFCIDTSRIWATGHSNGGGFVNVLACDPVLSNVFSVFTANSAALYTNATNADPNTVEPVNTPVQAICSPARNNLAFLEMHGTADGVINYYGGQKGKTLPSISHWITDWALRDGLSPNNVSTALGPLLTQYQFGSVSGNLGLVTQLTLAGWVHQWPTIAGGAPVDGGQVIMNFFYTWSNASRITQALPSANISSSSLSLTSTSLSFPTISVSLNSTALGITLSNTTSLLPTVSTTATLPLTASASVSAAGLPTTAPGGLGLPGTLPSGASVSLGASVSAALTLSVSPSVPGLSTLTISQSLPSISSLTLSPSFSSVSGLALSPSLPSGPSLSISPSLGSAPSPSISPSLPSAPSLSISPSLPSAPSLSISPSLPSTPSLTVSPSLPTISSLSLSPTLTTISIPSTRSLSVPSVTISLPTTSLGSLTLSVPSAFFSLSLPSTSITLSLPGTTISLPSTTLSLPSTSLSLPSTTLGLPSTSLSIPSTTLGLSSTSISLLSTSISIASISPVTASISLSSTSIGIPTTSLSLSSLPLSTPSTTLSLPSTSINALTFSVPSTSLSGLSTSLALSSLSLPSTSLSSLGLSTSLPSSPAIVISTSGQPSISLPSITTSSLSLPAIPSTLTGLSATVSFTSVSTSLSVPQLSPSVSTVIPSVSSTTASIALSSVAPGYACPANDGAIVSSQNGLVYQIKCYTDTYGANAGVVAAAASFNDCFYNCDTTPTCQAFTYSGGPDGTGSGLCYLKSGPTGFQGGSAGVVAVVRYTGPYTASLAPTINASTSVGVSVTNSLQSQTLLASNSAGVSAPPTSLSAPTAAVPSTAVNLPSTTLSVPTVSVPSTSTAPTVSLPSVTLPSTSTSPTVSIPTVSLVSTTTSATASLSTVSVSSSQATLNLTTILPLLSTSTSLSLPAASSLTLSSVSLTSPGFAVSFGIGSTAINPPGVDTLSVSAPVVPTTSLSSVGLTSASLPSTSVVLDTLVSNPVSSLPSASAPSVPISSQSLPTSVNNPISSSLSLLELSVSSITTLADTGSNQAVTSSNPLATLSTDAGSNALTTFDVPLTTALTSVSPSLTVSLQSLSVSTSVATPCPTSVCGNQVSTPKTNNTCYDPFGNHFSVTCGFTFTGGVAIRQVLPSVNDCLLSCDTFEGCLAANYDEASGQCELLNSINGTQPSQGGAAAAIRPANVQTVYTAYATTTTYTTQTSTSTVTTTSIGVYGGQSSWSSSSTSSQATQTVAGYSQSQSPGAQSNSLAASTSSVPLVYGASSSPTSSSLSSQSSVGGLGSSTAPNLSSWPGSVYGSAVISKATSTTSGPSSATYTGPVCPLYNGQQFVDAQANTYLVTCDTAYQGTLIPGNYKLARQSYQRSAQYCMAKCDSIDACVAVTVTQSQCLLYSSTSGRIPSIGSTSLYRTKRAAVPVSVITISTCAAGPYTYTSYSTTTISTTTTLTCANTAVCATIGAYPVGRHIFV